MPQAELFSPASFAGQHFPPHIVGEQEEVLDRILSPGINLSLWERSAEPEISEELSSLKGSAFPDIRLKTSPSTFDDDVCTLIREQGLDTEDFPAWRKDLRRVADIYFKISEGRPVTVRLESSDDARCPRFHVDHTNLRLLCTYRGESTEWLTEMQTDREAQVGGAPNEDIIRFGEPSNFGLFTVGIMKGNAYPDNAGHGLVHRSPHVKGPNRTRILFCLDC